VPAPDTGAEAQILAEGCRQLSLSLQESQLRALLDYLALLRKWNSAFNLTAVRDPGQMVVRHLLDSLSVLPHVDALRIADVGSGGGLPGIPLAIARPDCQVTLLDSNGKKTRFMFQAVNDLGLGNCEVVRSRVEAWQPAQPFDAVISRAFASLADMIDTCSHLLAPGGTLLAMKGQYPEDEVAQVAGRAKLLGAREIVVPGLHEARCLLSLRPVTACA
jgi:16S rRNA (guanine527-N7)-methyltransferase